MKNVLYAIGCALFMALLLLFPGAVLEASRHAISLWLNNVLPSLLPFFVAASLLFASGAAQRTGRAFAKLTRRLRLPGSAAPAFILGAVSGYPVGARLVGGLLCENRLPLANGEMLLIACNLAGPMFMTGTVASSMLGCSALGLPLMVTHYAAALISAALYGFVFRPQPLPRQAEQAAPTQTLRFVDAFADSVNSGMLAMLRIGGILILFCALAAVLREGYVLGFLADALGRLLSAVGIPGGLGGPLLSGALEMTIGCSAVSSLSIPLAAKAAACSFLLSFGGCSVLMQTFSFAKVRAGRYALFKFLQGILSSALCFVWVGSLSLPAYATSAGTEEKTFGFSALTSLSVAIVAIAYSLWVTLRSRRTSAPAQPRRQAGSRR